MMTVTDLNDELAGIPIDGLVGATVPPPTGPTAEPGSGSGKWERLSEVLWRHAIDNYLQWRVTVEEWNRACDQAMRSHQPIDSAHAPSEVPPEPQAAHLTGVRWDRKRYLQRRYGLVVETTNRRLEPMVNEDGEQLINPETDQPRMREICDMWVWVPADRAQEAGEARIAALYVPSPEVEAQDDDDEYWYDPDNYTEES